MAAVSPGRITLVASIAGATHASIWWVFTLVYTVVKSGNFTGSRCSVSTT